jgi:2-oxoglutarate ferredoxin oxidoreductase subunit delta
MSHARRPPEFIPATVPRGTVKIIVDRCKGCGFCVEYCPKDVLVMSPGFNRKGYHPPEVVKNGVCVNCNLCEMICPDFAIFSVAAPDARIGGAGDGASASASGTKGEGT